MKLRFRKAILFGLLAITPVSLAADRERVRELGQQFICICGGCNQLLFSCNHVNCPSSGGMLKELAEQIDAGKSDGTIIAAFVDKFGTTVLSAPPTSGFNLTAWVMPFVALAAGAIMVLYFAKRFKARWVQPVFHAGMDPTKYQRQVEEELEKYTPED